MLSTPYPMGAELGLLRPAPPPDPAQVIATGLAQAGAFTFLEQAAQDAARRTFGDLRVDAYEPVHAVRTMDQSWEVLLSGTTGQVRVELAEVASEALFSNCAAKVLLARPTFTVQNVTRQH